MFRVLESWGDSGGDEALVQQMLNSFREKRTLMVTDVNRVTGV